MSTNTSYGTWSYVTKNGESPESSIADHANGADSDWQDRMEAAGAWEAIARDYRDAINDALPAGFRLAGGEFIGPVGGELPSLREIIESVDLDAIVARYDVDLV